MLDFPRITSNGEDNVIKVIFASALLAFIVAIFASVARRGLHIVGDAAWPFYAKKPLTQPKQILYHRLVSALPECMVLAQVQLSQVLGVKKGFNYYEWHNRINRMSIDFLVCLKDATVVAAIELDDKTHERPELVNPA